MKEKELRLDLDPDSFRDYIISLKKMKRKDYWINLLQLEKEVKLDDKQPDNKR